METAGYAVLTRLSGLLQEMDSVANNIANMSTTGFRREGIAFSEFISGTGPDAPSLSMGHATGRLTDLSQAELTPTGGTYDLAIEGPGFFLIETTSGERLTRAGVFSPSEAGDLVTPDGSRLLDEGGAPIFVPADASAVFVAADGTLSADGQPVGRIGLYLPADPIDLRRDTGVAFSAPGGVIPTEARLLQGFVEASNVDPVAEVARMIEVQRAYELGQGFLDQEDERIRAAIRTLTSS